MADGAKVARDWEGREVIGEESPDAIIKVWEISPHISKDYDNAVIRGYQDAVAWAKAVVEHLMDNAAERGATLRMKLVEMSLDDYREIEGTES